MESGGVEALLDRTGCKLNLKKRNGFFNIMIRERIKVKADGG